MSWTTIAGKMIHIYDAHEVHRAHGNCPFHKQDEWGTLHEYYDTSLMFFDCGTKIDFGYGYWEPPPTRYCPECQKEVSRGYWYRHRQTAKHRRNAGHGIREV